MKFLILIFAVTCLYLPLNSRVLGATSQQQVARSPSVKSVKAHPKKAKKKTPQRALSGEEISINDKATDLYQHYLNLSPSQDQDNLTSEAIYRYICQKHQEISSIDARLISEEIVTQGHLFHVDPKFAAAIISAESGFNKTANSPSGAKGLGQLMGSTYRNLGVTNPFDIQENVRATLQYLRDLISIWDGHSLQLSYAIAAYLRGPEAVKRSGGKFSHFTLTYLNIILKKYHAICSIEKNVKLSDIPTEN